MNTESLSYSPSSPTKRLVLLHGWGADADDLLPLGRQLSKDQNLVDSLEVIALRAPHSCASGLGRQWYELFPPDWSAATQAVNVLKNRLRAIESSCIPLDKTVLMGFSQGGAMAIQSGCELPLAGLIGCSAYPHPDWHPLLDRPPVMLTHGRKDEVVPYLASSKLLKSLRQSQVPVELNSFEGGHEIISELIPQIQSFISKWLA